MSEISDSRALLARINLRIALLRRWLRHDHGDEATWAARGIAAHLAQRERATLRGIADLLHVERAMERGRVHGRRFADLDAQGAWLGGPTARWRRYQLDRTSL